MVAYEVQLLETEDTIHKGGTTSSFALESALREAFFLALLLTSSIDRAEEAVQEAITSTTPKEEFESAILTRSVPFALALSKGTAVNRDEKAHAASLLPQELRSVLKLPDPLRHCFVLAILAGLPAEESARLLGLDLSNLIADSTLALLTWFCLKA